MEPSFAPGDLVSARGREWVALPPPRPGLLALRPLTGGESDAVLLDPRLELTPVKPAWFELPADAAATVRSKAALLADALRLSLRRGAGPFRSAAQLAFEPRVYQLVPLLMALRQATPRLLIADDVGVGKTLEAGLILRELMDRGEVDRFAVLCPPHLVEQWVGELKARFGIDAVAVTAATAARLERGLPLAQTLFDAYRGVVVSLDYIKAEKRRDAFARGCPDFVIVDEAHACVGTQRGRQQRFDLLWDLAQNPDRRLILLTATPHSGDQAAFARLLSLLAPEFGLLHFEEEGYRRRLARHFVQRRRADLIEQDWGEHRAFPKHETREHAYALSADHRRFQDAVLDYCFTLVAQVEGGRQQQRMVFWGTLALMRCIGSSPAAALSALRNRSANAAERLEKQIYDEDGDEEDAVDLEPAALAAADPALDQLIKDAEKLAQGKDPKRDALVKLLKPLIADGANPVVFCRYIATADHVRDGLCKAFPKLCVDVVTGALTQDERRDRVAEMEAAPQRLLVATDCLSEGVNLQSLFDTVVHYDLSWNPTRHQQREGRVDRFGQPAPVVRSVMMFSPDSAVDGAVLEVILRKAKDIREATGVTVPLPEERGAVTDALMAAMALRRKKAPQQLTLDFSDADARGHEPYWRDVMENEKRSRARYAQHAMKPQEVAPLWAAAAELLGSPDAAQTFIASALAQFGVSLEARRGAQLAHIHALPHALRDRLKARGLKDSVALATADPAPTGAQRVTRAHPLTAALADATLEAALDPQAQTELTVGRVGAWPTTAVDSVTRIALLRLRYKLRSVVRGRDRLLLAEEATLVALQGETIVAAGTKARDLLDADATYDLAAKARDRLTAQAHAALPQLLAGPIAAYAQERAQALAEDHARLRAVGGATNAAPSPLTVDAVTPPDVIGLFVLIPSET